MPKIVLLMMIKNEAASIAKTIESCFGFIDYAFFADTGSTDGTQELIKKTCESFGGIPYTLVQTEFKDFATNRNELLDLAKTCPQYHSDLFEGSEKYFDWALMLSGDETLSFSGNRFPIFNQLEKPEKNVGAYYVKIHFGNLIFDQARLINLKHNWRYKYPVHELLCPSERTPIGSICKQFENMHINHDVKNRDMNRVQERFKNIDAPLLEKAHKENPTDTRIMFYLAQTYECIGMLDFAIDMYEKYLNIGVGQSNEEKFEACIRLGKHYLVKGERIKAAFLFEKAGNYYFPARSGEAFFALAEMFFENDWPVCFEQAMKAVSCPSPLTAQLFVDKDIYEWKIFDIIAVAAQHVNQHAIGYAYAKKAFEARPNDERLQKNYEWYRSLF